MVFRLFLDTNILADHLLDRNPDSSRIFQMVEAGRILGFASSASFFTLAYIIEKKLKLRAHPILQELNRMLSVIPTHQSNLDQAYLSGFKDLEDAFQYYTALNESNVDYFVSNNVKDFKTVLPKLPVVSSTVLVKNLIKEI
ncbi:MAG TPA: hypothetical protein DHV26_00480 [Cytophagales bacterium]|nr:hypothetical protein [Cytophagales bacterium]HRG08173.1 PIN domain-containing protein [Cyclobacteriaceae bacterium]